MSNTRKAKPDVTSILAEAKLPEKTVPLCLRGDLVAETEHLEAELDRSRSAATGMLVGGADATKIASRIDALRRQMIEATVEFRMRALSRRTFKEFVAKHPPRDGEDEDKALGVNTETFFDELVRICTVDPVLEPAQWDNLLDAITSQQWQTLSEAAWDLNRREVSVPFSVAASAVLRNSDGT